ncbi:GLPGLI family protein [Tenuifilum thalassicum]|uniref:GLPGLI family protein n=1 Tax=Tenuifilum thalassicum TaxID=2590900 RepID=A0A7D4BDV6_9BACT|nr:GLPGLI family protein [Tenuifilum thalassicum]QKG80143.1 GLPGLI family protein [Tenuifilum thalassicum]
MGKISWKIEHDTKIIGRFKCQKATCTFRGREYSVWFTPDIPVSFGPWKLSGLPGLILEAADKRSEILFRAVEINLGDEKHCAVKPLKEYPAFSLKDYVMWRRDRFEKLNEKLKLDNQVVNARQPEDFHISESSFSYQLVGLELEYEF